MSRLAELRLSFGLTQQELGARVGASRRAVQGWERDGRTPLLIYQKKLSRVLRVSISELGFS